MICICTSVNRNALYSYYQNNALTVPFLLFHRYLLWDLITWKSGESGNQQRHYRQQGIPFVKQIRNIS